MNFRLIDSHCHPQLAAYDADRDLLIKNTLAAGIGMVAIGTNYETSRDAVELADRLNGGAWSAIGVHPGHTFKPHHDPGETVAAPIEEKFDEEKFAALAASKFCVGVGEVGLDYYRLGDVEADEAKRRQRDNFAAHIAFALKKNLPLVLHIRDGGDGEAYRDAYQMIEELGVMKVRGVMHCFGGDATAALQAINLGFSIGIGGIVTFKPRPGETENFLWETVRLLPLERLLIETDAPYLAPAPFRGARNEPLNVEIVAKKIAEIRNEPFSNIAQITTANAIKLFNLAEAS